MAYSTYQRDRLAETLTEATHISLHDDDPGDTGAHELTGGTPAYARVALGAWVHVSTGVYEAPVTGVINIPPNTDVLWAGLWNGSTFIDKAYCTVSTIDQTALTITKIRSEA